MAADRKNIEEKTREIVNKDIDEGKEMQSFQEAQNQLLQIQAAQKENIQVNRALSSAQSQNNETMAQAAGIMASGVGDGDYGGPVQGREIKFNPQTQAILGKYGYGKPKTQSSTQVSSGPVQGRGVIINNRTENKTTNNVQVNAPQTPVITKKGGDGGMAKFKAWISGTFAKQKEQETIRERNFRRQEWSLSRSSSKIMDKLEEVGKTIGERMDPRKISAAFMDQFKVLMFLLGFQFLSKNWEKILTTVDNIEKWIRKQLDYFGVTGKKKGERSEFVKSLISFFGGNPEGKEGVLDTLRDLFKDAIGLLGKKFNMFFEDRAEALKALRFPTINPEEGTIGIIKSVAQYLGDILKTIIGGRKGIESNIRSAITAEGRAAAMGANEDDVKGWGITDRGLRYKDAAGFKDTDLGDASVLSSNIMESYHYNDDGSLANNTTASLVQSNNIAGMITEDDTAKVHTVGVMTGFENLANSVNKHGKTLVSEEFFEALKELSPTIRDRLVLNEDAKKQNSYKFIRVKKEQKDFDEEGANAGLEAGKAFIRRASVNSARDVFGAHGTGSDIADTFFTGDILKDPGAQAISSGLRAKLKELGANDYKLVMVPASDPRPGELIEYDTYEGGNRKTHKKKFFTFYSINPHALGVIKTFLSRDLNNSNFNFDVTDKASMEALDKGLRKLKEQKLKKRKEEYENGNDKGSRIMMSSPSLMGGGAQYSLETPPPSVGEISSDYDNIMDQYSGLENYDKASKERNEAFQKEYNESQTKQFVDNVKEGVQNISKTVRDKAESYFNTPMTDEVQAALKLIQGNEGFEENDYESGGDGKTTLGFGMTVEANPQLKKYRQADGTYKITREQATEELTNLIIRNKKIAKKALGDIWDELNVNQKAVTLDMLHGNPNAFRGKRPAFAVPLLNRDWETLKGFEPFRVPYTNPKLEEINRDGWDNRARLRQLIWNTPVNGQPNLEGEEGTYESEIASESTTTTNSESPIISQAEQQNLADTSSITPAWQVNNEEDNIPSTIKRAESVDYSKPVMWKPVNTELASSGTPTITKEVAQKVKGSTGGNGSESIILELQKITKGVNEQGEAIIMLSSSVNNLATVAASNGNNTTIVNNSNNKQSAPSYTREPNTWPSTGFGNGDIAS